MTEHMPRRQEAAVRAMVPTCPLCTAPGGHLVWQGGDWRVVRAVDEPAATAFPVQYRVVCAHHVAELSDLPPATLQHGMALVVAVERALRGTVEPAKINVASLGNQVPHLHWHVIARHAVDSHFPDPVWSAPRRACDPASLARLNALLPSVDAAVLAAVSGVQR